MSGCALRIFFLRELNLHHRNDQLWLQVSFIWGTLHFLLQYERFGEQEPKLECSTE